jgi:hypothetical protein
MHVGIIVYSHSGHTLAGGKARGLPDDRLVPRCLGPGSDPRADEGTLRIQGRDGRRDGQRALDKSASQA